MRGQALLLLLLLQHSKSDSACNNLKCFVDYIRTLTCMWDTGPGTPRGKLHNLTATWDGGHGSTCTFLSTFWNASHLRYTCSSEQKPCIFGNTFAVTVTTRVDGAPAVPQECGPFKCYENIKPQPPFNVTAAAWLDGYNVSWESGYTAYDYLHGELQYQLRYRQKGHPWSPEGGLAGALKPVLQDTQTLQLLSKELEGGVEYELQVRAGLRDHSLYKGTWSDWSPSSSLWTPPRGTAEAVYVVVMPLLVFSVIVTLVAFLCKHQRPWKKLEQFIPSPAPFFQALYLVHNGDFKKWVGTSCSGATLDVYECGTALPEVFRISPAPKPLLTTPAPGETSAPHCTAALPAFTDESPGSALEPAYGHLSIDTVTVADACGLEPEDYRCLPLDSSHLESLLPFSKMPLLRGSSSSGPWHQDACLAQLQTGAPPEHQSSRYGPTQGGPVSASSPPSTKPLCRKPLSPVWSADGDPGNGLDLDTVDSGFADSDCGSPVDCEFQGMCASCAAPGEEKEGTAFLPSYVKQWVACHLPPAEHS